MVKADIYGCCSLLHKPLLFTNRPLWEGGAFDAPEERRIAPLFEAIRQWAWDHVTSAAVLGRERGCEVGAEADSEHAEPVAVDLGARTGGGIREHLADLIEQHGFSATGVEVAAAARAMRARAIAVPITDPDRAIDTCGTGGDGADTVNISTAAALVAAAAGLETGEESGSGADVVGEVEGKHVVMIDDIISTGSSMIEAAAAVMRMGAARVTAGATHALFAEGAVEALEQSTIEQIVVTNTLVNDLPRSGKIKTLSVAELLGEARERLRTHAALAEQGNNPVTQADALQIHNEQVEHGDHHGTDGQPAVFHIFHGHLRLR